MSPRTARRHRVMLLDYRHTDTPAREVGGPSDGCTAAAGLEDLRATEELCPKCFLIHPKGMCDYD